VPTEVLTNGSKELTQSEWSKICQRHHIYQVCTEPRSPWQNHAELIGGILKRKVRHRMKSTLTPIRLWDYGWEYTSSIYCLTESNHILLDGVTPHEKVLGFTPDISEYLAFTWYQWVWYYEPNSDNRKEIARRLGPVNNCGQSLAYHILTEKGKVITRSTFSNIVNETDEVPTLKSEFTRSMESFIGNDSKSTADSCYNYSQENPYGLIFDIGNDAVDDEDIELVSYSGGDAPRKPDVEDFLSDPPYTELSDEHIGLQVNLPHKGEMVHGKVIEREKNPDGSLKGKSNPNPILDSRSYKVEFRDGAYGRYSTNTLIENLYSQIDEEGRSSIVNPQKDEKVAPQKDGYITLKSGVRQRIVTTKEWSLNVEWVDGTPSWIPLSDLKESNPIEVAEYAIAHGISNEPAFAWWAPHVINKRHRIMKSLQFFQLKKNMKYGIDIPSTVKEAHEKDNKNGNTFWGDAIKKELSNVIVAFQLVEDGDNIPLGSKLIPYQIIFDVKIDLTRMARLVAGGHRSPSVKPHASYSSVASRDSIRLCFMLAALNEIDILMGDIGNAYLNVPNKERVHVICGPELFGPVNQGKKAVIIRALYGLKTAGNSWRQHFSAVIRDKLGYESTVSDPDVYRKVDRRRSGELYYSYFEVYIDDVLCIREILHLLDRLSLLPCTFRQNPRPHNSLSMTYYLG